MKQKLLLLLMFIGASGIVFGQGVPWDSTLIITEVDGRAGQFNNAYWEITNVGDKDLDLADFKFIQMSNGSSNANCEWQDGRWQYSGIHFMWLPDDIARILKPGESFVATIALDFMLNGYNLGLKDFAYGDRAKNHNIYPLADFIAHRDERGSLWEEYGIENGGPVKDSVTYSPDSVYTFGQNYGFTTGRLQLPQNGLAIEQHYIDPISGLEDSIVIDQVKNTFVNNCQNDKNWYSVAGVDNAMRDGVVFRKATVKKGELDWYTHRGLGLDDSEWMALKYPEGWDNWREYWWTVGNHGPYTLDASTLTPKAGENITVDFSGKSITVPWGVRRLDDIMMRMEYTPGVAWIYMLNGSREDSVLRSAQNGDKLAVFVLGNTFYSDTFDIVVADPTTDANLVVPVDHATNEPGMPITNNVQHGKLSWPRITMHGGSDVVDTITAAGFGLPHDLRIDSLKKYLEKAPNADWEIVTVDGAVRADLKNGDILKVTAENGDVKDYFLEVRDFEPSDNANLVSITWPDNTLNPAQKFIYGWQGDTIPNFNTDRLSYRLTLPANTTSIPALVVKPENVDVNILIDRATTFNGSVEDRTTTFTVISESLEDTLVYTVELALDVDYASLQPYTPDPFISQDIPKSGKNSYLEICNPGTRDLDLSHYMIVNGDGNTPEDAIANIGTNADSSYWAERRYMKYIPGRKWVDYLTWGQPGDVEAGTKGTGYVEEAADITVEPIIGPGEVFTLANFTTLDYIAYGLDNLGLTWDDWDFLDRVDVQFNTFDYEGYGTVTNNWNEPGSNNNSPMPSALGQKAIFIFKILNDSVRTGLKAANDPDDFELVETMAMANYNDKWYSAGADSKTRQGDIITRKPEYTLPNPVAQASFGDPDGDGSDSEWIYQNRNNNEELLLEDEIGAHFFNLPTSYKSTVKAVIYDVSSGYSDAETIKGVTTGTGVSAFLGNLYKADPGQTLSVIAVSSGDEITGDAAISENDTLIVVSADGVNTTKYILSVSDEGLSADATLSSDVYDVTEDADAGTGGVAGMPYGTPLQDVVDNVEAHPGAVVTPINENDLYVPFTRLNYFNEYVESTADYDTYLEVVAENTVDKILYQLQPEVEGDTALITSFVYEVSTDAPPIIKYVPLGTSYVVFMDNIITNPGATVNIFDKFGYERTSGDIAQDDKVVATSPSGDVQTIYYLSLIYGDDMMQTVPSLAFITSEVYEIDQVSLVIDSVVEFTTVADFMSNITPATDAEVVIYDADETVKTEGELAQTDVVVVTSADGQSSIMYSFGTFKPFVGIQKMQSDNIQLYPNPTKGNLEIRGLSVGSHIQIYNTLGAKVIDVFSMDRNEVISLAGESDGLYYIVISKDEVPVGNYKVIKN